MSLCEVKVPLKDGGTQFQYGFSAALVAKLGDRVRQTTKSLMREVGGVVKTENGLSYAHRRRRGSKILVVAHCDAVDHGSKHFFHDPNPRAPRVWSSRLDDRMGVWMALDVLPLLRCRYDVLLTDGEETGKSTARYFRTDRKYNWIVQFDRSGCDAVHYQYYDIRKHLSEWWDANYGSYTDVRELDSLGCCAANLGVGYHAQHTLGSYANLWETGFSLYNFACFYQKHANTLIPYTKPTQVERVYGGGYHGSYGGVGYSRRHWNEVERRWEEAEDWRPRSSQKSFLLGDAPKLATKEEVAKAVEDCKRARQELGVDAETGQLLVPLSKLDERDTELDHEGGDADEQPAIFEWLP